MSAVPRALLIADMLNCKCRDRTKGEFEFAACVFRNVRVIGRLQNVTFGNVWLEDDGGSIKLDTLDTHQDHSKVLESIDYRRYRSQMISSH